VESGATLPPSSPLCTTLLLLQGTASPQMGAIVRECQLKRPRAGAEPPTDSLSQLPRK
jgi:hypothetical protein